MILAIIVSIIVIIALLVVGIYNNIQKYKLDVEQALGNISVFERKRLDLIPNLVETIKGYANHESDVFKEVAEKRRMSTNINFNNINDIKAIQSLSNEITSSLSRLLAVSENYPELKASPLFMNLQKSLTDIETEIEGATRYYNGYVTKYNKYIMVFPNNIIANVLGAQKLDVFNDTTSRKKYTGVKF